MNRNKNPTYYNWADKVLKPFVNKKGYIEFDEDMSPGYIQKMYFEKTIPNDFLITMQITECPVCGSKLYCDGVVEFNLNNTVKVYKQKMQCSNEKCGHNMRPLWSKYIDPGSNYTKETIFYALNLKLIDNASYEKISEKLELFNGTKISRETVYKIVNENISNFISEKEDKIRVEFKNSGIKTSDVLSYDEQYIPIRGRMVYRLAAMDPVTNYPYFNIILEENEFNEENIFKTLKPIVEEYEIKTIVTDGAKLYPKIIEKLKCEHKKCNFHKMQNFMNKIKNTTNRLKRKIKTNKEKIESNNQKIEENKKIRKNKKGRLNKNDKEGNKLVKKSKKLRIENSKLRSEIKDYKTELEVYEKCTHNLSLMLKSKTKKTGIKRYKKIMNNFKNIPSKIQGFIKNIIKDLDKLLLHTLNENIPTTNNCIELYFKVTLQKVLKKKYKTKNGVINEIRLKTIRWINRVVLS